MKRKSKTIDYKCPKCGKITSMFVEPKSIECLKCQIYCERINNE